MTNWISLFSIRRKMTSRNNSITGAIVPIAQITLVFSAIFFSLASRPALRDRSHGTSTTRNLCRFPWERDRLHALFAFYSGTREGAGETGVGAWKYSRWLRASEDCRSQLLMKNDNVNSLWNLLNCELMNSKEREKEREVMPILFPIFLNFVYNRIY